MRRMEQFTVVLRYCCCNVAIKTRDWVRIQWSEDYLCNDGLSISKEVFKIFKYNKHLEGG